MCAVVLVLITKHRSYPRGGTASPCYREAALLTVSVHTLVCGITLSEVGDNYRAGVTVRVPESAQNLLLLSRASL